MKTLTLSLVLSVIYVNSSLAQCHFVRANSTGIDTVAFSFVGGSMASYGCLPIDPTFWLAGNGTSITATFVNPQSYPAFRIWGMNDDDIASVSVNGIAYPLDFGAALIAPKVVCGISPGPDGVAFSGGNLTGANSPALGNFSYNDVQLNMTNVNSITVTGIAGAGWGFAGVLVDCPLGIENNSLQNNVVEIYPNPVSSQFNISLSDNHNSPCSTITLAEINGKIIQQKTASDMGKLTFDVSDIQEGIYLVKVERENVLVVKRVVVIK